jgi:transposase
LAQNSYSGASLVETPRKTYRPWNPDAYRQQAYSPQGKLPEDDLVFFLLDVIDQLDLSALYAPYEDQLRGAPPFDPRMMSCLWLYAYSVGVFSSRKVAKACERNLAFLTIVGDERPDFRTISDFRKLHLDALADLFHQVLRLAHEAGLVQLGAWATDGSKFPGNASRHKAMSYGRAKKEEERLEAEIAELLKQQQQTDEAEDAALGSQRGDELPAELRFREQRLVKIQEAKKRLEEQAQADAERQRQQWQQEEADRLSAGKKPRQPKTFSATPDDKAQTNFTDPELKIMPQANKSWEYSGNAQAVVDDSCQIIMAADVVMESNDKRQAVAMAEQALTNLEQAGIERPLDALGVPAKIAGLYDTGYFSDKAVSGLEALGLAPYIATERHKHHAQAPVPAPGQVALAAAVEAELAAAAAAKEQSAQAKMRAKLQTEGGRAVYGLRKGVVEPVFGQIKAARGFRRFSLRGLEKIRAEWRLVCLTHNLLKIWRYHYVPSMN